MSSPKFSRLDPAQRRDQILDAANALLAARAYDEVSIEDIASAAGVTRGLVHHYFGGRKDVYVALLERLGAGREGQLPPPEGRSARARVGDSVSRWLDWTESNRTIWLATIAHGEDIADPDVRRCSAPRSSTCCARSALAPPSPSARAPARRSAPAPGAPCGAGAGRPPAQGAAAARSGRAARPRRGSH